MPYQIDLSDFMGWVKSHPLLQQRCLWQQNGYFGTWEVYLKIRNLNVTVFTINYATRSYKLSYYLKAFHLKGYYGIQPGMPNSCPVKHDDVCRSWRLLDKMFKCLVDSINDCADKAHDYQQGKV